MGPAGLNYPAWLAANARHDPDRLAVVDPAVRLTYGELVAASRAVARGLLARGLEPGRPVALALDPSAAYLVLVLGALEAGVVPAFVNTRLAPREVRAYLDRIAPQAVVHDGANAALVADAGLPCVAVPNAADGGTVREQLGPLFADRDGAVPVPGEADPAIIFPTGGTTGLPKGCYTSHRGLMLWNWNVAATGRRHRDEVELFFSPFFHVSLIVGLLAPLLAGGTVVIEPAFAPASALESIRRHGVTRLLGAPTVFAALFAQAGGDREVLAGVRDVGFGAASWTDAFVRSLFENFPEADIFAGYGATEYASTVSAIRPEDFRAGRISGAGRPLPGCAIRILGEDDRPLPQGETGQIAVRSPWQTLGYWNQPEETAATYGADGFVRLGDMGHFDDTGWLTVSGRLKEMIKTGGENVFPIEVEQVLTELPGVAQAVAFGLPDEHWGERVEAAVVAGAGSGLDGDALRAMLRGELAAYKVPKRIHVVDAIPLTAANKPDRLALQERFGA